MKKIILVNKKEGHTPLEALLHFKKKNLEYKNMPMTYAGRLDPMASGLLLILAGEEVKNKEKYLKLDKEYEFEILFGFATDTYDILGKVQHSYILKNVRMLELEQKIKQNSKYFTGKFLQKYPKYSSKTIKKVRAGIDFEPEEREVFIKSFKFVGIKNISAKKLLKNIERRIEKVKGPARNAKGIAFAGGDFRQKEILKIWRINLYNIRHGAYVAKFKINCSSGTYVRAIANSLGTKIGIPALTFSIKRTKIGKWRRLG